MKNRRKLRQISALLLALLLLPAVLLLSCAYGIEDPLDDLTEAEDFAPYLSVEEADVLFGAAVPQVSSQFDGPYLYYIAKYPEGGKNPLNPNQGDPLTVYRYNCETGVAEYACQDPVCTHNYRSGCPFENVQENGPLAVIHGYLIYLALGESSIYALKYYRPETRTFATISEDVVNYWLVGDFLYYNRYEIVETPEDPSLAEESEEIWRWDPESGESKRIYAGDMNSHRTPLLLEGKEMLLEPLWIDPAGNISKAGAWLYRLDPETGERSLAFDKPLPDGDPWAMTGDWFLYRQYDPTYWETHNGGSPEMTLHLANFVTGEDRELGTYAQGNGGSGATLTEHCVLWLQPDPQDDFSKILYRFDIRTGERSEYRLQSLWDGMFVSYHRGRLYLRVAYETSEMLAAEALRDADPQQYFEINIQWRLRGTCVEWDILTGRQRVIDGVKVFEPKASAE